MKPWIVAALGVVGLVLLWLVSLPARVRRPPKTTGKGTARFGFDLGLTATGHEEVVTGKGSASVLFGIKVQGSGHEVENYPNYENAYAGPYGVIDPPPPPPPPPTKGNGVVVFGIQLTATGHETFPTSKGTAGLVFGIKVQASGHETVASNKGTASLVLPFDLSASGHETFPTSKGTAGFAFAPLLQATGNERIDTLIYTPPQLKLSSQTLGTSDDTFVIDGIFNRLRDQIIPANLALGRHTVLSWDGVMYICEGTVDVSNLEDLEIRGPGGLRAMTAGLLPTNVDPAANRERSHFRLRNAERVSIIGMQVLGNKSQTVNGTDDREAQHGIEILSSDDIIIDGCDVQQVWGDFYNVNTLAPAETGGTKLSKRVTIQNCTGRWAGRLCVGANTFEDLTIKNCNFGPTRRSFIDVEPFSAGSTQEPESTNLLIEGNTWEQAPGGGTFLLHTQNRPRRNGIIVRNNTIHGKAWGSIVCAPGGAKRLRPILFTVNSQNAQTAFRVNRQNQMLTVTDPAPRVGLICENYDPQYTPSPRKFQLTTLANGGASNVANWTQLADSFVTAANAEVGDYCRRTDLSNQNFILNFQKTWIFGNWSVYSQPLDFSSFTKNVEFTNNEWDDFVDGGAFWQVRSVDGLYIHGNRGPWRDINTAAQAMDVTDCKFPPGVHGGGTVTVALLQADNPGVFRGGTQTPGLNRAAIIADAGLSNAGAVVSSGTITTSADGQLIENKKLMGGIINVNHDNVTVRNCWIEAGPGTALINAPNASGLVVDHCKLVSLQNGLDAQGKPKGPNGAIICQNDATVRYCDISGFSDGIKAGNDSLYEHNYIHMFKPANSNKHLDGIQGSGRARWTAQDNVIWMPCELGGNFCLFAQGFDGTVCRVADQVVFQRNFLYGGNFAIQFAGGKAGTCPSNFDTAWLTNCSAINNKMVRDDGVFGPADVFPNNTGFRFGYIDLHDVLSSEVTLSGNTFEDGTALDHG